MSIQLLPAELANQIAAGEVVERPASVVKELVENSIDAGATKIEVDIEQGGHKRILVRDNGNGIVKQELTLALSRHATSKITSLADLEAIQSMGFRGEALASISSVSRLTLTSKPANQNEAWQAHTEGREMQVNIQPAAHPNGTSIDVLDLFFNTPARRRFLRTAKTEFAHIEQIMTRIALANPTIEFVLKHNDRRHKQWKATENLTKRIEDVLGKGTTQRLLSVDAECEGVRLEGFIVAPTEQTVPNDWQYSFVNGRPMRDKLINHAIKQAFVLTEVPIDAPQYVLFVHVDPAEIDVNVHPAKHEVRFHHARLVHDFIVSQVKQVLLTAMGDAAMESPLTLVAEATHGYQVPDQLRNQTRQPVQSTIRSHNATSASIGTKLAENNYANLMRTPASTLQTNCQLMQLKDRVLVGYQESNLCFVIEKQQLLSAYLKHQLGNVEVAQPLLMPVAIPDSAAWDESRRQAFAQLQLHIDKVASKRVLKQVPAGWRAMPWSILFNSFAELDLTDLATSLATMMASTLTRHDYPLDNVQAWFISLPQEYQRELLQQTGQPLAVDEL
ncbi:DNA mismatch repair endonuclease MutL [Alteromonas flava]|uniref:DNA mismatch repair endonuclease MutL n=1 Tax=Alteromonas flava TaxID=2048003 RepID=UPI000C284E27|nr:DNA mismatch repair endonuclease MutL [Alteromonas flava]